LDSAAAGSLQLSGDLLVYAAHGTMEVMNVTDSGNNGVMWAVLLL
jgi:3-methyladenine DNA glycosylase Mpg